MSELRPGSRAPLRSSDSADTVGAVRRLDSGRTPNRHPAVRWPDERRPRPMRVDGPATPVAEALRRRFEEVEPPEPARPGQRGALGTFAGSPEDVWGVGGLRAHVVDDDVYADDDAYDEYEPDVAGTPAPSGATATTRRRARGGVEANARLTGATAAVLLVLLAIEGVTILRIFPLLSVHVFIGMLLIPIVLVKIGSVTWRFAKYYLGDPQYRRRGPPAPLLRLLGPILIVLTLVLLFSGVALVLEVHGSARLDLLRVHQVSFVLWFIVMAVHVLGHFIETAKLAPRDWYWRTRGQVRGATTRQWVLASSVVLGLIVGAVMLPHVGAWLAGVHSPAPLTHAAGSQGSGTGTLAGTAQP